MTKGYTETVGDSGGSRPSDKKGGAGHPDTEIRGGLVSKKNFFRPFGPHFCRKIREGGRAPRAPPLDRPLGDVM